MKTFFVTTMFFALGIIFAQDKKHTIKMDLIGPSLHLSSGPNSTLLNIAYERKLKDNLSLQINTFYLKGPYHIISNPETRHHLYTEEKNSIAIGRFKENHSHFYIRPNLKWYFLKGLYMNGGVLVGYTKKEEEFDGRVDYNDEVFTTTKTTKSYAHYKGREIFLGASAGLGYAFFVIKDRLSIDVNFTLLSTTKLHKKGKSISEGDVVINNSLVKPAVEPSISIGYSF